MENVRTIVNAVKDSFWIGNRDDTVYGVFTPDETLYTNNAVPYRLTFRAYNAGRYAVADSFWYDGGVMTDGRLVILDDTYGVLEGNNRIRWNNGDVWNRVSSVPAVRENGTELQDSMDQRESAWLNQRMRETYPYFTQFNGM
jgi:hypothetical protein